MVDAAPVSVLAACLMKPPPISLVRCVCPAPTVSVPVGTITMPSSTISVTADDTETEGVVLVPVPVTGVPYGVVWCASVNEIDVTPISKTGPVIVTDTVFDPVAGLTK